MVKESKTEICDQYISAITCVSLLMTIILKPAMRRAWCIYDVHDVKGEHEMG